MKVEQHRVRLARCIYTGHVENLEEPRAFPLWDDLPVTTREKKATRSQSHWLTVADFVIGWQDIYS